MILAAVGILTAVLERLGGRAAAEELVAQDVQCIGMSSCPSSLASAASLHVAAGPPRKSCWINQIESAILTRPSALASPRRNISPRPKREALNKVHCSRIARESSSLTKSWPHAGIPNDDQASPGE